MKLEVNWEGSESSVRHFVADGEAAGWFIDLTVRGVADPADVKLSVESEPLWPVLRSSPRSAVKAPPAPSWTFVAAPKEPETAKCTVILDATGLHLDASAFRARRVKFLVKSEKTARSRTATVLVIPRKQARLALLITVLTSLFVVLGLYVLTQVPSDARWTFLTTVSIGLGTPTLAATLITWLSGHINEFGLPMFGATLRFRRAALLLLAPAAALLLPRLFFVRVYNEMGSDCVLSAGDDRTVIPPHRWELRPRLWGSLKGPDPSTIERSECAREACATSSIHTFSQYGAGCEPARTVPEGIPMSLLDLPRVTFHCKQSIALLPVAAFPDGRCPARATELKGGGCSFAVADSACKRQSKLALQTIKASFLLEKRPSSGFCAQEASVSESSTAVVSAPFEILNDAGLRKDWFADLCLHGAAAYSFEWPAPARDGRADEVSEGGRFVSAQWRTNGTVGRTVLPADIDHPGPATIAITSDTLHERAGVLTCSGVARNQRCFQINHSDGDLAVGRFEVDGSRYIAESDRDGGLWTCIADKRFKDTCEHTTGDLAPRSLPGTATLDLRQAPKPGNQIRFAFGTLPQELRISVGGAQAGTLTCALSSTNGVAVVARALSATFASAGKHKVRIEQDRKEGSIVDSLTSTWESERGSGLVWGCFVANRDVDATVTIEEQGASRSAKYDAAKSSIDLVSQPSGRTEQPLPCVRNPRTKKACPLDKAICDFRGQTPGCEETWDCPCP